MDYNLYAKRINNDQERLISHVLPLIDHSSIALRQHLGRCLKAHNFNTHNWVKEKFQRPLADIMMAGTLAGANRAYIIRRQSPTKLSTEEVKASLELSILGNAVSFAKKVKVNLSKLREKYKTTAFNVLTDVSTDINAELHDTVTKLIKSGAHINEAKEVLGIKFDKLGIRPASKGQFETIFRTMLQITFAAGKYKAETSDPYIYRELWGYRYITNEDSRVRPTHEILDGVTLPKDDPFWYRFYPPNGWNCRCQAIPIFVEMPIVQPPKLYLGQPIKPDKGFDWLSGTIFNPLAG